jgi:hypothetical protein
MKEARPDNSTYIASGVLVLRRTEKYKFEIQFFVENSVVKFPTCV